MTIDSGSAVCGLPKDSAEEVEMEELIGPAKEYLAANAESIAELGAKTPTLEFQNGDVERLRFKVMDKLHKPLVAASKVVNAGNRVVLQQERHGGSYIENLKTSRRKKIYEKNGVYVLPSWIVSKPTSKTMAPLDQSCPNERQGNP